MADASGNGGEQLKTPKDKKCRYCGQPFTSSSLGRHLDLYIKDKNPKPPDGVHDVEEIRRLRGGITRRQARGTGSIRREASTPVGTPSVASKKSPPSEADSSFKSPDPIQSADTIGRRYSANTPWEVTGVINPIRPSNGEFARAADGEANTQAPQSLAAPLPRVSSRQMMKVQLDTRAKIQDALDTTRASELALWEIFSSIKAAKLQIDLTSMPFDFEPLSLDFPALTLQCLEAPPTLFSSTQHPTSTSWSILPPGRQQFDALCTYFTGEITKWRNTCVFAGAALTEESTCLPPPSVKLHGLDSILKVEKSAEKLESQVREHVQSSYAVWEGLPHGERERLWTLELARSVGRKQKDMERIKETEHRLRQGNENLKSQVELLSRSQQPREFKASQPGTLPISQQMLDYMIEEAVVHGKRNVGLNVVDQHSDLSSTVSASIDRWKQVIVNARAATSGLQAQRTLSSTAGEASPGTSETPNGTPHPAAPHGQRQARSQPTSSQPPTPLTAFQAGALQQRHGSVTGAYNPSQTSGNALSESAQYALVPSTARSSVAPAGGVGGGNEMHGLGTDRDEDEDEEEDEDEDADADAEMDDGNPGTVADRYLNVPDATNQQQQMAHQVQNSGVSMRPTQQNGQLGMSRASGRPQQQQSQFGNMNGNMTNMSRSMVNIAGMPGRESPHRPSHQHMQMGSHHRLGHGDAVHTDMSMMIGGEPMYMD